ncbi:hypothetical protein PSENEW3n2_00003820 [Picochlorum sp. SENEW3]|nr:hypothetical protein PSENEW3n2_00003820 [Picochlorum sp. SENEW3]WPT18520.1 hypothetical protein PSENEW3_00003820 [Picochlorum sp. SENEW3]
MGTGVVLPRSQSAKKKFTKPMAHANEECKKKKNTFVGTGSKKRSSRSTTQEEPLQGSHPFMGALDALLRPLPPDWQYNIQRAIGAFGETVGRILPNQNEQKLRIGRRGF